MQYNSSYGVIDLTQDGLFEVRPTADKQLKNEFSSHRMASVYLVEATAQHRDEAALAFVRALHRNSASVVVVTDKRAAYSDTGATVYDVASGIKRIVSIGEEMEERYLALLDSGYYNAADYNNSRPNVPMNPVYVVLDALDEFSARLGVAMNPLIQIARKGRAAGIYVIACGVGEAKTDFEEVLFSNCFLHLVNSGE